MNVELIQKTIKNLMGENVYISFTGLYTGSDHVEKVYLDKNKNVLFQINGKKDIELKNVSFWTTQYVIEYLEYSNKVFAKN